MNILVKKLNKDLPLPKYQTSASAGMDLYANVESDVVIKSGEFKLIKTGIAIKTVDEYCENGIAFRSNKTYEAQVRARSGLALKHGIGLVNGIGTIDSDYTGEVGAILINCSDKDFVVHFGDRIAQLVINEIKQANLVETDSLENTQRGNGGFGSTGE